MKFFFFNWLGCFITYVITTVIFAIIYIQLPNDFYHSTSHLEPSVERDREWLFHAINQETEKFGDAGNDWFFMPDQIRSASVRPEVEVDFTFYVENDLRINVTKIGERWTCDLPKQTNKHRPPLPIKVTGRISKVFNGFLIRFKNLDVSSFCGLANTFHIDRVEDFGIDDRKKCKDIGCVQGETGKEVQLVVPNRPDFMPKLDGWWGAMHGKAQGASDNWARMLYFSTVTMTTLGYGDIVPLSTRARLIISAQSLFGLLLIGLFVNSIANRKPLKTETNQNSD